MYRLVYSYKRHPFAKTSFCGGASQYVSVSFSKLIPDNLNGIPRGILGIPRGTARGTG